MTNERVPTPLEVEQATLHYPALTGLHVRLLLDAAEVLWNELDKARMSTPYPQDKPLERRQQDLANAMTELRRSLT